MKRKILSVLAIALVAVSCGKLEDQISALEQRIAQLEDSKIPSIDKQISSINGTISDMQKTDSALKDYIIVLQQQDTELSAEINKTNGDIVTLQKTLRDEMASDKAELFAGTAAAKAEVIAQLDAYKVLMEGELATIDRTIKSLKAQDSTLLVKIEELKAYVDSEISNTKDWASATFATIEQQNALSETVAGIKTQLETLNTYTLNLDERLTNKTEELSQTIAKLDESTKDQIETLTGKMTDSISSLKTELTEAYTSLIAQEITALETSLKGWVNEQLSAYYTAEQVDAKLSALSEELGDRMDSDKTEFEGLIATLKTQISMTKTEIVEAYTAAIKKAIEDYDGTITSKIASDIAAVDTKVANLQTSLNSLSARVSSLEDRVNKVEEALESITSISYIPKYPDQTERVEYTRNGLEIIPDEVTLKFDVHPASSAEAIAREWDKVISARAVYTITKSSGGDLVSLEVKGASASDGILSVVISTKNLDKDFILGNLEASIVVKVSSESRQVMSEYVNLISSLEEGSFISYLLNNFDTDGDGQVNVDKVMTLDVSGYGFTSIDDILAQASALTNLDCSGNNLTSLDFSNNPSLKYLNCSENQLVSLTLSKNTALTTLKCTNNQSNNFTLDLLNCPKLADLDITGSKMTSLTVVNTALTTLDCGNLGLTSLTVSDNSALTVLNCRENRLTAIDMSTNSALTTLYCGYNQLTAIDISANAALTTLDCSGNQLTAIDISANTILTTLNCDYNSITTIDLSHNPALTKLYCNNNNLASLDLSYNPNIEYINCEDNKLTSLELSNKPKLTELNIMRDNSLTSLIVVNTALTTLNCSGYGLASLTVAYNTELTNLDCSNNNLISIDLSKNESLSKVNLSGNANLTRVVCKSLDWALGCYSLLSDESALYFLTDGTQITLDSFSTDIDGKTWKQFNVGARLGARNLSGNTYYFDEAKSVCPTGWRLPTKDELSALSANYSGLTWHGNSRGRWFSGSQTYSSSSSAIFLPISSYTLDQYWSSTEYNSSKAYCLSLNVSSDVVTFLKSNVSNFDMVRCLKD